MTDECPETWQEFIDNFRFIDEPDGEPLVPMRRVEQMMKLYHEPLVRDLDTFVQACEELHDIPAEDEMLRLEKENERLRKLAENLYSEAYFEDADEIEYKYGGEMRELGLKMVSWD